MDVFQKLCFVVFCLVLMTSWTLTVSAASMCADDKWYFDMDTLRCRRCTVCLEELGEMESEPCTDFKDAVCVQHSSPRTTEQSHGTERGTGRTIPTPADIEFATLPPFDPDSVSPEKRVGDGPTIIPEPQTGELNITEQQANEITYWKNTCYALSVTVLVLSAIMVALSVFIYRSIRHNKQVVIHHGNKADKNEKHDPESGVYTNMRADKQTRIFTHDRLSTSDFLRTLSKQDKGKESREGLFDQVIHPPPDMYTTNNNEDDVFYQSDSKKQTLASDSAVQSPNTTTTNGKIITNEGSYSKNGARLQDPTVCTKTLVGDFIPSTRNQANSMPQRGQQHTVVYFEENRGVSVSTSKSFEI